MWARTRTRSATNSARDDGWLGAFLAFVFGMYLLAALFLGIVVIVAVWAWSGPVTTERRRWRFLRQPELGPMYGPIPLVWMFLIVTTIAQYIYFDVILE